MQSSHLVVMYMEWSVKRMLDLTDMKPELLDEEEYDETEELWSLRMLAFDLLCGHARIDVKNLQHRH